MSLIFRNLTFLSHARKPIANKYEAGSKAGNKKIGFMEVNSLY